MMTKAQEPVWLWGLGDVECTLVKTTLSSSLCFFPLGNVGLLHSQDCLNAWTSVVTFSQAADSSSSSLALGPFWSAISARPGGEGEGTKERPACPMTQPGGELKRVVQRVRGL